MNDEQKILSREWYKKQNQKNVLLIFMNMKGTQELLWSLLAEQYIVAFTTKRSIVKQVFEG